MQHPHLTEILALVAERRGVDFRDYRRETLERRAELRVRATGSANLEAYASLLRAQPAEIDRLVETLVIPVTEFFRDGWVFGELAERVVPELARRKGVVTTWVAGAATGEEAYSIAMVLADVSSRSNGAGFEVVASDIDRRSLEVARAGVYAAASAASIPDDLRRRYLRGEGDKVRIAESVRQRVRFAEHDLVGARLAPTEAIVASFDLVLCRNVLLYFDDSLRATAAERLASVLEPDGVLVLGTSEPLPPRIAGAFRPYPGAAVGSGIYCRRAI